MYRDFGVNPVNLTKPPLRIPTKAAFDSEIALVSRGS